jgi:hypothetical protein
MAKQASHEYIDDSGEKVPMEQATGSRYTSERGFVHEDYPQGKGATPGTKVLMLANFGGKTLAINTTSGARQQEADEEQALVDRWASLDAGQWRERAEGIARGPKYDKAVLATCLVEVLGSSAKGDADAYLERLDDKSYYAKVRNNSKVMTLYHDAVGSETSVDNLA